jgi:bidirectional [NiFe] hydrogenase diaphorase subunit
VKGAAEMLAALERLVGIKAGETTSDEEISLEQARCLGACGIAPAVVVDGAVLGQQTPESVLEQVKGWLQNGSE